ncbi:MAG: radical SAM protein [Actinobacteria bacterium]|nr:radical SAM protein [Actinomycetota bacterium]
MNVLLVSTYELGHQPFGLASPARWLRELAVVASVRCVDLAVEQLADEDVAAADLIACYVPMHTATRLAAGVAARIRDLNPGAHLCFYGLYAPMNESYLRRLGGNTILGGEFEEGLAALARRIAQPAPDRGEPRPAGDAVATAAAAQPEPVVSLARQSFLVPDRAGLPDLSRYARLIDADGTEKKTGYTEATRGCKHTCRHCPIVPVYGGRFRVVQRDVVLADIENLVQAGAEHITFGDPDFFNGPAHAIGLVTALHERFPRVSYDVTIKVEHLVRHAEHVPALAATGCLMVTSAVESFDDHVLTILDKRHTKADFIQASRTLAAAGIAMNPTFVAFTPYGSIDSYIDFLDTIRDTGMVPNVAPVQYAIRLLLPQGSLLLDLPETRQALTGFDEHSLCHRWAHPDPRMDQLQAELTSFVADVGEASREEVFSGVLRRSLRAAGRENEFVPVDPAAATSAVPRLDEPWYCCAEPTEGQLAALGL